MPKWLRCYGILHLSKCQERLHALKEFEHVQGGYLILLIPASSGYLKQFRIRGAVDSRHFEIFKSQKNFASFG